MDETEQCHMTYKVTKTEPDPPHNKKVCHTAQGAKEGWFIQKVFTLVSYMPDTVQGTGEQPRTRQKRAILEEWAFNRRRGAPNTL